MTPRSCATFLSVVMLFCGLGCASPAVLNPVVEQFTIAGDSMPSRGDSLRIATFNVYGLANKEGLRQDFATLSMVDVWLLQEVAIPRDTEGMTLIQQRLRNVLPAGEWNVAFVRLNEEPPGGPWEAQAIISRLPVRDATLWKLPTCGPKRRAALVVTIDTSFGPVRVVNTDHEVSFFDVGYGNRQQVAELVKCLNDEAQSAVVVGGDFNTAGNFWRLATSAKNVADVEKSLATAGLSPLIGRTPKNATFRLATGDIQIDHLFVRGLRQDAWGSPQVAGSDHRPVWAQLSHDPSAP